VPIRALVILSVAIGSIVAGHETPRAGAGPTPVIILYGDSISQEAFRPAARVAARSGFELVSRAFGGTSVCDWLPRMATDADLHPEAVILQFSGNYVSECSRQHDTFDEVIAQWLEDAAAAFDLWQAQGTRVYWATSPTNKSGSSISPFLDNAVEPVADSHGASMIPAATAVLKPDGRYAGKLPCLARETPQKGCNQRGKIRVRAPDGGHFCPSNVYPCSVYSSGAYRYGSAMVAPVISG
jgi:GDSL-like lipase/acylhydrolase family protein